MADMYLSNQPAGTYGGVVWGTPSDANDGASSASPKLTADNAFQLYDNSIYDGGTLFINDGEYTYTASTGRWILNHASSNIQPMTDYGTTVTFSGTNTQALRYNFDTEARTATIGKIIIKTSADKTSVIYSSGSSATLGQSNLNCEARIVPNTDGTANSSTRYGIYDASGSGQVNILGGGVSAADGSLVDISAEAYEYIPYFQFAGLTYNPAIPAVVNISAWALNIKMLMPSGGGVIDIDSSVAYPTGSSINISGVTGTVIAANSASNIVWLMKLENQPDNTVVDGNTVSFSALNNSGAGGISLHGKEFDSLNNTISNNDLTLATDSGIGFGILLGAEGTTGQYANTSGDITDNTVVFSNTGSGTNAVHGLNHIHASGTRTGNTISGVSIGSLTKASNATSSGNTISIDPLSGSKVHLYAKGAYAGASFNNETLVSTSDFSGAYIQALVDDTTGGADVYSDNTIFSNITITGDVGVDAKVFSVGWLAGDNSTAIITNVVLPTDAAILNVYGRESEVTYTTIVDANALSWVTNINQPSGVDPIYTVCSLTVSNSYQSTQFQASTVCPLGRDWGTKRYTADGVIIPNYIHDD